MTFVEYARARRIGLAVKKLDMVNQLLARKFLQVMNLVAVLETLLHELWVLLRPSLDIKMY